MLRFSLFYLICNADVDIVFFASPSRIIKLVLASRDDVIAQCEDLKAFEVFDGVYQQ